MPVAAIAVAAVSAGASIYSSMNAAKAAKAGTSAQVDAADKTVRLQREIWQQQRADNEPWRLAGVAAIGRLNNLSTNPSAFTADPGYQWRLQQGVDAIDRSAAARGRLSSGGTMKALTRYGQGYGSQEFSNVWNRQAGLAGVGQTANAQNAQDGQNYANNAGNAFYNAGQARATGYANVAAAQNQAIGTAANAFGNIFAQTWPGGF